MSSDLAAAVAALYATFGTVPRPRHIDYCPCCLEPAEERALLAPTAVADLPVEVLKPYAAKVILTVGGVDDFRYFLPRLLEIVLDDGFGWPALEPLVSRLRHAGWAGWPVGEREAVRGFLSALWTDTLRGGERYAPDVLCAIGNAEDDLTPYLAAWTAALREPAAAAQLLAMVRDGRERHRRRGPRLTNGFWAGRDEPAGQVLAWLSGPDLARAAADAFEAAPTEDLLGVLAEL